MQQFNKTLTFVVYTDRYGKPGGMIDPLLCLRATFLTPTMFKSNKNQMTPTMFNDYKK